MHGPLRWARGHGTRTELLKFNFDIASNIMLMLS